MKGQFKKGTKDLCTLFVPFFLGHLAEEVWKWVKSRARWRRAAKIGVLLHSDKKFFLKCKCSLFTTGKLTAENNLFWFVARLLSNSQLKAFITFFLSSRFVLPFYSEEAVKRSGNPNVMMKNPSEMESQVYSKAKTKVSVLDMRIKFLVELQFVGYIFNQTLTY